MAERGIGDFFISDADEEFEPAGTDAPPVVPPVSYVPEVVPQADIPADDVETTSREPEPTASPPATEPAEVASVQEPAEAAASPVDVAPLPAEVSPATYPEPAPAETYEAGESAGAVAAVIAEAEATEEAPVAVTAPAVAEVVQVTAPGPVGEAPSREQRLIAALDELMADSADVQAAALVSLDGFIMASALPEGMHEDKVGAMSAAILGLGERAAIELGRGALTQVFIEGDDGYVLLVAAGDRAVLTVLADAGAKLGLVLYDMRNTSATIAQLLG